MKIIVVFSGTKFSMTGLLNLVVSNNHVTLRKTFFAFNLKARLRFYYKLFCLQCCRVTVFHSTRFYMVRFSKNMSIKCNDCERLRGLVGRRNCPSFISVSASLDCNSIWYHLMTTFGCIVQFSTLVNWIRHLTGAEAGRPTSDRYSAAYVSPAFNNVIKWIFALSKDDKFE
jgi:hypothetical protein